jgi:hypothetical protein
MDALYAIGKPRENGFNRLSFHFFETADAGDAQKVRPARKQ